jgi:hypothetical protein
LVGILTLICFPIMLFCLLYSYNIVFSARALWVILGPALAPRELAVYRIPPPPVHTTGQRFDAASVQALAAMIYMPG